MYLGESEQYTLRLDDGTFVRAVEFNPTAKRADVGDRAALQVHARDVIVLPREEPRD
jgi:hypothetical protein